ncbi:uncharacterized protein LOC143030338 [Oratosquilla oratoria]|uniref:uncharacterized protein LOC143030338 n=1 Tax=Oratosquilla oratoria TaxID=337810 RepID=UPI003F770A14
MDGTMPKLSSEDLNQWIDDKSFPKQIHKTDAPPKAHIKLEQFQFDNCKDYFASQQDSSTLEDNDMTFKEEKILNCDVCHLTFATIDELECHGKVCVQKSSQRDQSINSTLSGSTAVIDDHCCKEEEMQYHCPQCDMAFYQKGDLQDHIKKTYMEDKPHKCTLCHAAFSHAAHLKVHTRIHTGEKPYKCSFCVALFRTSGQLKSHMLTHTGEKPHKCSFCGAAFSQSSGLQYHIRKHTGERPYKCEYCDSTFSQLGTMKTHMHTHTGERPHKCSFCDAAFAQKASLRHHIRKHTGERPYKCECCVSTFSQLTALKTHMHTHTGERPHKCSFCVAAFPQKTSLQYHIRKTHTGERPYKCDQCDSTFLQSVHLKSHMQTHTGQKPHKCGLCGAAFSSTSNLKKHIQRHTGEKPYKCEECGAAFIEANKLRRHIRVHKGKKPYISRSTQVRGHINVRNVVLLSLSEAGSLHMRFRIHTGEKAHKCTVCVAAFSHAYALKRHMETHSQIIFMVEKWAADFKRGRDSLEDDPRQERPATVTTQEIIDKIHVMLLTDRRLTGRFIATELGISQECVHAIIHNHLGMTKVSAARWVPKFLGPDQKRLQLNPANHGIIINSKVGKVVNILKYEGDPDIYLLYHIYKVYEDFYTYPVQSSSLGIYAVSNESKNLRTCSYKDIECVSVSMTPIPANINIWHPCSHGYKMEINMLFSALHLIAMTEDLLATAVNSHEVNLFLDNITAIVLHCRVLYCILLYCVTLYASVGKAPHTITLSGCFTVVTVYHGLNLDTSLGRRTILELPLISLKVLSSLNITFCHCSDVQSLILSVRVDVFFGAPEPGFLGGTVPGGCVAAAFFRLQLLLPLRVADSGTCSLHVFRCSKDLFMTSQGGILPSDITTFTDRGEMDGTMPKLSSEDLNQWIGDDKSFPKQIHKTDAPPKAHIKLEQFQFDNCKDYFASQQDSSTLEDNDMTFKEEKILNCDVCHLTFATIDELECHGKVCVQKSSQRDQSINSTLSGSTAVIDDHCCKEEEMQYHCPQCDMAFYQKGDLQDHIKKTYMEDKPHKCTLCHAAFSHAAHLKVHTRIHTGEKPYKCSFCVALFRTSGQLKSHMLTHTGEKPHKCSFCGAAFSQSSGLQYHIRKHTGERPYKCEYCDSTFSQLGTMKTHMHTHTGERPHKCSFCDAAFAQKASLRHHIRKHTGERPYKCECCVSTFSQLTALKTHMHTHTGERPHKCSFCVAAFPQKTSLQYHIRKTHTGERPYKCDQCDSTFLQSVHLKSHMQTHTGQKPHKCGLCGAAFSSTSNLKKHIQRHTGEKPYKCEECGAAFIEANKLRRHIRVHKGKKP